MKFHRSWKEYGMICRDSPVMRLEMIRGSTDICRTRISSSPGKDKYLISLAVILLPRREKPRPTPEKKTKKRYIRCIDIFTL